MKKKVFFAAGIIAVLLVCALAAGCKNSASSDPSFVGTWRSNNPEESTITIVATSDGNFTMTIDQVPPKTGTWTQDGDTVTLIIEGRASTGKIAGNTFTDGDETVYTRQ